TAWLCEAPRRPERDGYRIRKSRSLHGDRDFFVRTGLAVLSFRPQRSEVEKSLTISVAWLWPSETSRDVSRSTRFARSGQALNIAAVPLLNGCNVTLPLDMTETAANAIVLSE